MNLLTKITGLGREIHDATSTVTTNLAKFREAIAAKTRELSDAKGLPVTKDELAERFCRMVDERAAYFASGGRQGPYDFRPTAASFFAPPGVWAVPQPVRVASVDDLFSVLCLLAGDTLKAGAPAAIARMEGWGEGMSATERPQTIARIERELAELEKAEEALVDEMNAAGIRVEHRPEVTQRRYAEARRKELADRAAENRRAREAALNQQHASRTRAMMPNLYLARHDREA